jgi:hypothetical protein
LLFFLFASFFPPFSGECEPDYWKDLLTCRTCGSDDADKSRISVMLALAIVMILLLAIAVATLRSAHLSLFVTGNLLSALCALRSEALRFI